MIRTTRCWPASPRCARPTRSSCWSSTRAGPFHPGRLHEAIDDLLDGVVRVRGRAWLASQPDAVVWIESAGGGLGVGNAGRWLAAMTDSERGLRRPRTHRTGRIAVG